MRLRSLRRALLAANLRMSTPRSTTAGIVASARPAAAMLHGASRSVLSRTRPLSGLVSWRSCQHCGPLKLGELRVRRQPAQVIPCRIWSAIRFFLSSLPLSVSQARLGLHGFSRRPRAEYSPSGIACASTVTACTPGPCLRRFHDDMVNRGRAPRLRAPARRPPGADDDRPHLLQRLLLPSGPVRDHGDRQRRDILECGQHQETFAFLGDQRPRHFEERCGRSDFDRAVHSLARDRSSAAWRHVIELLAVRPPGPEPPGEAVEAICKTV